MPILKLGASIYYCSLFSKKLHEIEKMDREEGRVSLGAPALHLPMAAALHLYGELRRKTAMAFRSFHIERYQHKTLSDFCQYCKIMGRLSI